MDGMQIGRRQILAGGGAAVAAGALAATAWPSAAFADEPGIGVRGGPIGTWLIDVVSDANGPGDRSLVSFVPGGAVIAVDGSRQDPIPPQLGRWEKRPHDGFAATFVTFLYDNDPSAPALTRIGLITIVVAGTASGGAISGQYRVAVTAEATNDILFQDTGSFSGAQPQIEAV
jgi:hypothetical protein